MRIIELPTADPETLDHLVDLSQRAARITHPTWMADAAEAREALVAASQGKGAARALEVEGRIVGWVAAGPTWRGIWKLHPLLIDPELHGRGYGRQLVAEVEALATEAGARIMGVTTADATEATTLSGRDLYPLLPGVLSEIALRPGRTGHAFFFWRRVGYTLSGVVPDSGGVGIPSLQLVKRLNP